MAYVYDMRRKHDSKNIISKASPKNTREISGVFSHVCKKNYIPAELGNRIARAIGRIRKINELREAMLSIIDKTIIGTNFDS